MDKKAKLGLRENIKQFSLLVLINAFVGGMVGMERSIFPDFAESEFGISSHSAILSFIIAFGISKAIANYYTGKLSQKIGSRKLLILGWILALPVPFILINADIWLWVVIANVLLGISQGLTWSSTVIMKIDLAGDKNRGLAMGINEFAGYMSVGIIAFISGYIAETYGLVPYPFYLGIVLSVMGFLFSILWVQDTRHFVDKENFGSEKPDLSNVFSETSFKDKTLSSVTQAGMVNNLNDGMIWGLLPIILLAKGFGNDNIGIVAGIYPIVWGIGQLFTGKMSDHYSKKAMLFWGMLIQGFAIVLIPWFNNLVIQSTIAFVLGLGTALVYPTFLTTIAAVAKPKQRAESIGVFRLWRDLGYAIGAILSGVTADYFGVSYAFLLVGVLTIASSLVIQFRFK